MGNNSLQTTEKNLRSIAKRYENVKYSVGLAVLFLMKGTSAFSDGNIIQEAEKQKDILTDIKKDKIEVKETKKAAKTAQKLKASWTNMQFGANDLYSNFFVAPKTKVEKTSIVKSKKTVLVASADNSTSLPMFAKLLSDIEEKEAPTMEEIQASKGNLRNSIGNLQDKIDTARKENNKEINGLRLELIQLMEQGNQVVKSPWASWQFGANYFNDSWGSAYKGRGDKKQTENFVRDTSKSLDRYLGKLADKESFKYSSTDLVMVEEPDAEIRINTRIIPIIIEKKASVEAPKVNLPNLPRFSDRVISVPKTPKVKEPNINITGFADFPGRWINGVAGVYSYWRTDNGVGRTDGNLYQTSVESGEVLKRRGGSVNRIQLKNYQKGKIQVRKVNRDLDADGKPIVPPSNTNIDNDQPTFFMSLADIPYSYFGQGAKLSYINEDNNINGQIFIHFETERNNEISDKFDKLKEDGHITEDEFKEIRKYTTDTDFKNTKRGELYHVNKGTVELGGVGLRYIQTTFWGGMDERVNLIENRGNIISMNYEEGNIKTHSNAIFLYGPDTGTGYTGTQHIYANNKTGKISMYGEKGYLAVFTASSTLARGDVSFINNGEANLYGRNNVGLYITTDDRGKLSEKSNFIMNSPINLQGDNSTGLYVANSGNGLKNERNTARFVIGAKDNDKIGAYLPQNSLLKAENSKKANHNKDGGDVNLAEEIIGIYLKNQNAHLKVKIPQLDIERFAKKSIGVYAEAGKVEATEGNITLKGGKENIALYAKGGKIDYTGNVTVKESSLDGDKENKKGTGNMAVYATSPSSSVKVNGNIEMDTEDTVAVYSDAARVDLNGVTNIKLTVGKTGQNVGVYAKNNATTDGINLATNQSKIEIDGTDPNDKNKATNQGVGLYTSDAGKITANGTSLANGLNITVKNGAAAIASDGNNSKVEAKYSTINYNGNGFALYAKNDGEIDVSNSEINLYGKATGFERSGNLMDPFPLNLSGATFKVHSNDVAIMNLKNVSSLTYSGLVGTLFNSYLGGAKVEGVGKAKNYKMAVIDGLNKFDFDSDFDKSLAADDKNENTKEYILARQMLIRRAKLNLKEGFNVKAVLSSAQVDDIGLKTPVGLGTAATASATNNNETQINLEKNTTVTSDRTDKGAGAIGLYMNYGKINIAEGATVNVEKEDNVVNENAVGAYAVNGTEVKNAGNINVGGKNSIGILGLSHRIDDKNTPIVDQFGDAKIDITNEDTGTVSLDGKEAIGIFINNNKTNAHSADYKGINLGKINMSGDSGIGMYAKSAQIFNNKEINMNSDRSGIAMFGRGESIVQNRLTGTITLKDSLDENKPNMGLYTDDIKTTLENYGKILGGKNTYGIYGKNILHTGNIAVGDNSIGVFSNTENENTNVNLVGEITVGNNKAIGFLASGEKASTITSTSKMKIDKNSFGFVLRTNGSTLNSNYVHETILQERSVYIYSDDVAGNITNKTKLKTVGDRNYGIYAKGNVTNLANMDLSSGFGNIGILHLRAKGNTTSKAVNSGDITVGKSNRKKELYSIGMAAGYLDKNGVLQQTGEIENHGTINVNEEDSIGIYAAGFGSKAINYGNIELSGKDSIGMYLTDGAKGYNYGNIRTAANNTADGIKGVVATNKAVIYNYGNIEIKGEGNTGIYLSNNGTREGTKPNDIDGSKGLAKPKLEKTTKRIKGLEIDAPGNGTARITRNGKPVTPTYVDTMPLNSDEVTVGSTRLDLRKTNLANIPSLTRVSSLGMYVDTSGREFTNPIKGLENLKNLDRVNLIFGVEAARYTDSKNIQVGKNILKPYNEIIPEVSRNGRTKFRINSASLTWIATGTQDPSDESFNAVYLSKIPYTSFTKDKDTYNFMDGLEQRYGIEGIGSREKTLFDKLNAIGKGEPQLLAQAVDEMKGSQYANTQQRVEATGNILDKEFNYLRSEWQTLSKDSNKIKTFGANGEYNTNTAGIKDYKNYAYGVAYVHEDETVRLGESTGWYAGIVHNTFKFKDIRNSKEEQLQGKVGIFKSVPFDHNNGLNWTISGDVFAGYNKMNRRFLVVDEIFNAKSKYHTYGANLKNELSKEFRLSEGFSLRSHASLGVEYGRISKIKEKSGEMKLEVKSSDYISVKPEVGAELAYKHHFGSSGAFKASVEVAYENELGRVASAHNKARVARTTANWYDLKGEKEDREGNVKFDLKLGFESEGYGVTANVGYDTKGHNVRSGVGLRVKF